MFIIYNKVNKLYWNDDIGWVDRKSASKFTKKQAQKISYIPLHSVWVKF